MHLHPWLQNTWQQLTGAWRTHAPAGALLLSGQAGIGKSVLLRALAQALLCEHAEKRPCGTCRACTLADAHPDYLEIAPAEDKTQKQIVVDQVRLIADHINRKAINGGARIVAVLEAETLNINAANALLKMLEEPNENCFFLLTSNAYYRLLPTIISRTQRIKVPRPSNADMHAWLDEHVADIAHDSRTLIIDYSGGNMTRLQTLCSTANHQALNDCVYSIGMMLAHKQAPLLPHTLTEYAKHQPVALLDVYLWIVDHLVRIALNAPAAVHTHLSKQTCAQWQYLATSVTPETLFGYHDTLLALRTQALSGLNPNLELALSGLLCTWRNDNTERQAA